MDWDKVKTDNKEVVEHEEGYVSPLAEDTIDKLVAEAENAPVRNCLNCLVVGKDGSAKTGIIMHLANKYDKKTLFIDLDGGDKELKDAYYPTIKKIITISPLVSKTKEDDIVVDYKATIAKIKGLVLHVGRHIDEYDAIVLDGLSALLKDSEYLMRMEKNMQVDGGVNQLYWKVRHKTFVDVLEIVKSLPNIDKFYIAHEDFDVAIDPPPGQRIAAPKLVANRMIHQRIRTTRTVENQKTTFKAEIDKSKYNVKMEGKEFTFCTVENGTVDWNPDIIFEGLRGNIEQ